MSEILILEVPNPLMRGEDIVYSPIEISGNRGYKRAAASTSANLLHVVQRSIIKPNPHLAQSALWTHSVRSQSRLVRMDVGVH